MTTRTTRPSARVAQLDLLREGEIVVHVGQPIEPALPEGMQYGWGTSKTGGRQTFYLERRQRVPVRVSYKVWSDPVQLADLAARSLRNKSGEAIRGWATARAGVPMLNMTEQRYKQLISGAANVKTLRAHEGPVRCQVKWLGQPAGAPAMCTYCKRGIPEHETMVIPGKGKWIGGRTRDAHYDPEFERQDTYYLCPLEVKA